MRLSILLVIALFFSVFGAVFGFQICAAKDAFWALLLTLLFSLLSVVAYALAILNMGFVFATMFAFIPVMRFGMEQVDADRTDKSTSVLSMPIVYSLFAAFQRYLQETAETSLLGRFARLTIAGVPVLGPVSLSLRRFANRFAVDGKSGNTETLTGELLGSATTVIMDIHRNRLVIWFYRICGMIVLTMVAVKAIYVLGGWDIKARMGLEMARLDHLEQSYSTRAGKTLGEFLAENCPGQKILLVQGPNQTPSEAMHAEFLRGFEDGLGGKLTIGARETVPGFTTRQTRGRPDPKSLPPVLEAAKNQNSVHPKGLNAFSAAALDRIIDRHSDCNLVLMTCDLPADFADMRFWEKKPEKRPKLVLTDTRPQRIIEPLKRGLVTLVLVPGPGALEEGSRPAPGAPAGGEDEQSQVESAAPPVLLIHAGNLGEISREYPAVLGAK